METTVTSDTSQTSSTRTRVGVVAADPLRSVGLLAILESTLNVFPLAMPMADPLDPATLDASGLDALLLDSRSALDDLTDVIARLRRDYPTLKIVVMGERMLPDQVQAVIGAGAKGYLAETAAESEIRMAMEVVLDGSIWAPRKVLARLIEAGAVGTGGSALSTDSVEGSMTPRELEVLHLLMDGLSNRDIAGAMGIDEVTVKAHLGRMLRKTRSSNRVELTLRAIEERSGRGSSSTSRH